MKYILIILLLCSCGGTRQSSTEYFKVKSNYDFTDKSYILNQNVRLNDIGELNPIDNSKPFFVDGKEYFNVSIKFDKSKIKNFELNKKNIGTSTGTTEVKETKQTERKDNTLLYLGSVLIIGCLVFLWFYLPKLKV